MRIEERVLLLLLLVVCGLSHHDRAQKETGKYES